MAKVKATTSKREQTFRVSARVVPAEELLQLFGNAFGTEKKAKEISNNKFYDELPY